MNQQFYELYQKARPYLIRFFNPFKLTGRKLTIYRILSIPFYLSLPQAVYHATVDTFDPKYFQIDEQKVKEREQRQAQNHADYIAKHPDAEFAEGSRLMMTAQQAGRFKVVVASLQVEREVPTTNQYLSLPYQRGQKYALVSLSFSSYIDSPIEFEHEGELEDENGRTYDQAVKSTIQGFWYGSVIANPGIVYSVIIPFAIPENYTGKLFYTPHRGDKVYLGMVN